MDLKMTVTLTPRVLRWAIFYQLRHLIILIGSITLALIGAVAFMARRGADLPTTAYALPIFLLFLLFFAFYSSYSRSMAVVRKMKSPRMKYRITDKYFYVETDLSSGKNSWSVFKGLQKNGRLWLVVIHSGAAFLIPTEFLDEKLKAFLSSKLPSTPVSYLIHTFKWLAFYLLAVIVIVFFVKRG
jgi:membrane protein implicated in regulation of membrane protease activity